MASAKRVPADILIELTLTREEAQAFQDLCIRVGGNPHTTRRGIIDRIAKALYAVDIVGSGLEDTLAARNSIWFR